MSKQFKEIPFEAELIIEKAEVDEKGQFHIIGRAATKDLDLQGDVISMEAMEASAGDLLENSTVLFNHMDSAPIGKVVKQSMDSEGTVVDVIIDKDAVVPDTGSNIISLVKQGILNKFSIRAKILDMGREYVEDIQRTVNVIRRMLLMEVSLVSVPANPQAKALEWYISKALSAHADATKALVHSDEMSADEPEWGDVDKSQLIRIAFAEEGVEDDRATWLWPHHWVANGNIGPEGIYDDGDLLLHRQGLIDASAAVADPESGATEGVIEHLRQHRIDVGLESEDGDETALSNDKDQDEDKSKMDTPELDQKNKDAPETPETEGTESTKELEPDTVTDEDGNPVTVKADEVSKGASLGRLIDGAIDDMVTDDLSRADIIAQIGTAAGIEAGTVGQIVNGSIDCPPLNRLEGFADVLPLSMSQLLSAGNSDGCNYEANADNVEQVTQKGFPIPGELSEEWSAHCESKGISKATAPVDVLASWHEFCKSAGYPFPFAFPYPTKNMTVIDEIILIADDLLRNTDDVMVETGAQLKMLALVLAEAEIPEPMGEVEESAPKANDGKGETSKKLDVPEPEELPKKAAARRGVIQETTKKATPQQSFSDNLPEDGQERLLALCKAETPNDA